MRKRLPWTVIVGCSVAILGLARVAEADSQGASDQRVAVLVRDLGAPEFSAREEASRELLDLGIVAHDALLRATQSDDAEVRVRARRILVRVLESDFQDRLEAFAAHYEDAGEQSLPAWDLFSADYGTSRLARELFVEMQRAEPEMLAALAEGPKAAADALNRRTREILDGQRESLMQLGTLASLLFVGAAPDVKVDEDGCLHIYPYVVQSTYHRNHKSPLWPSVLKKLVGRWIAKDTTPAMTNQNLILAATLELKSETLAIAGRVLDSDESPTGTRQIAILMISRFGDKPQIKQIEDLLEDATNCGTVQVEKPPHQVELQIRDVALAALLHMTGQDLKEYGYDSAQEYGPTVFQVGTLGFADAATREAALKKWSESAAPRILPADAAQRVLRGFSSSTADIAGC